MKNDDVVVKQIVTDRMSYTVLKVKVLERSAGVAEKCRFLK